MARKMCKNVDDKMPEENPEKFRKKIKNAQYYCKNCGLVSNKKKHLCKPNKIE